MEQITLFVGVVFTVAVLFVRPVYGLILYVAATAWYPSHLAVSLGTVDFTVRRIVILAVLAKLLVSSDALRSFRLILVDKVVIVYFAAEVVSGVFMSRSATALLENRAGAVFDMVLPYFAVRMALERREQYMQLLKGTLLVASPLAIFGLAQSITGWNPFAPLLPEGQMAAEDVYRGATQRFGLFRGRVMFQHSIMFGLFFAMLGPMCAGILHNVKRRGVYKIGLLLMGVGVFSSMSSGPFLAGLLAVLFIVFYRWHRHWKTLLVVIVLMCACIEVVSNRHFYDVLGRFTFSAQTAWYRSRLISVALFEGGMSGHWLMGYGYDVDPGWGPRLDGSSHTDTVNHYILELHRFGLVALVPFLWMNLAVVKQLRRGYRVSRSDPDRWLIWCLSGTLFGLWATMMTVSLFGPPTSVFFMLLAIAGVLPGLLVQPARIHINMARVENHGESPAAFQPSTSY